MTPPTETMYGVVGRMEALRTLVASRPEYRSLLPFLEVYYRVTKAVVAAHGTQSERFRDPHALERLDVYFASLYFSAVYSFLNSGECVSPWRGYFAYSQKPHQSAFVSMLLGINAHINGDLAHALAMSGYSQYEDFIAINEILKKQIRAMLVHLATTHGDAISAAAWFLPSRTTALFESTIVEWRSTAWRFAAQGTNVSLLWQRTEGAAEQIEDIFASPLHLLRTSQLQKDLSRVYIPLG